MDDRSRLQFTNTSPFVFLTNVGHFIFECVTHFQTADIEDYMSDNGRLSFLKGKNPFRKKFDQKYN
jgi:hypothetical protein